MRATNNIFTAIFGLHPQSPSNQMAAVDFSRYKRIVQYLWDPEPTNLDSSDLPLWCLGDQYTASSMSKHASAPGDTDLPSHDSSHETPQKRTDVEKSIQEVKPPESVGEGIDSGFSQEGTASDVEDGGWPVAFLDDFESKLRFSYRTGFPVIPRSEDPKASSAMSFSVRLRSQLSDQGGFSSDTGWGCMIRSGQSLLANSMVILRLSRGTYSSTYSLTRHPMSDTHRLASWCGQRRRTRDSVTLRR